MGKKKILIVDDEKDCCEFLKEYLAGRDCLVEVTYDGSKAKNLLENEKYDYIFFDCNMPGLSGIELIKVINKYNPEAKKIMISGYDLINEDFAKDSGVDEFLNKPILLDKIAEIIKE